MPADGDQPGPDPAAVESVVDAYMAAWHEPDASVRAALLDRAITDDCELTGPTGTFRGRKAIGALIAALQDRMGEARAVRSGPVEVGEDGIRFPWELRRPSGDALLGGVDVVEVATDGRMSLISVAI